MLNYFPVAAENAFETPILFNMDFNWKQGEQLKHSWSAELGLQARNQKLSSNQPSASLSLPKDYFIFTEEIGIEKLHLELLTDSLSVVHCDFRGHHSHHAVSSQDPTERQGSPHSTSCSLTVPIGQSVTSITSLINKRHKHLILALNVLCYQPVT